jgi:hypothetical protein
MLLPKHTDTIPGTFAKSYTNPTKSDKSSDSSADDSSSNVLPCALVNIYGRLGGKKLLWNAENYLPIDRT